MRHFPSPALSLSFLFVFFWSRLLPFSLIQPGQWGCVQLPRLFSDCAEEKAPLHFILSHSPHSDSTYVSFICLNAQTFTAQCALQYYYNTEEALPIPFLSRWHSLKVFLSRGRVWHTVPGCSTPIYIFSLNLWSLLGIVVKPTARIIFQLFYWANKWHSKVTSKNKVQRDWTSQD